MQMWVLLFVCLCKVVTKLHRRGNSGYDKQSLYYLTCLLMKVCVLMCVCVSMCVCVYVSLCPWFVWVIYLTWCMLPGG